MADYVRYIPYNIWISDEAKYNFAVAVAGGLTLAMSPDAAGAMLGLPVGFPGGNPLDLPGYIGQAVGIDFGAEIMHPGPTGLFYDTSVDIIEDVPSVAGTGFPPGPDVDFIWAGGIIRLNPESGVSPTPVNVIPQRRWIHGHNFIGPFEGGNTTYTSLCRAASRTIGGFGFAIRGQQNPAPIIRLVDEYRAGLTPTTSWERFYFRIRTVGTTAFGFWIARGTLEPAGGLGVKLNTSGDVEIYNRNAFGVETLLDTISGLELDTWYRVDVLLKFETGLGTEGRARFFVNGLEAADVSVTTGGGINGSPSHDSSELGKWTGAVDNQIEMDLDDWISADRPANFDADLNLIDDNFTLDWLFGSHVKPAFGLTGSSVGWTGTFASGNQGIGPTGQLGSSLVSNTSGARIDAETDASLTPTEIAEITGIVAAVVGDQSSNAAGTDGQLGYSVAGGADVLAIINQTGVSTPHSKAYQPAALNVPEDPAPFEVIRTKSADANIDTTIGLQAALEYIGLFGPEDTNDESFPDINSIDFLHNCRYTSTVWGYLSGIYDGLVAVVGGTYVGNGTVQSIDLPLPCHFLWIRATNGAPTGGIKIFGAGLGAHIGGDERVIPNFRLYADELGQTKFTVWGTDADVNQNAITYQYIAFCDPSMRFNYCGAYLYAPAGPSPRTTNLYNTVFEAEAGFIQKEVTNSTSTTVGLSFRGPGMAAGINGVTVAGTNIADWGGFAAGQLITRSGVHYNVTGQCNYSLWRGADANCGFRMLEIFSYVGDGTASRVIPFPNVTDRFPLMIYVQPHNGPGYYRDPSHTLASSSNVETAGLLNTAITAAAMGQFTVGSTLNANGINYEVFIILGSYSSFANGIFLPGICEPDIVQPVPPPPPQIAVMGEGGLTLNGTVPFTLLQNVSGIYTIVKDKHHDTLIERQPGVTEVDVAIPRPFFKTGFIGG